MMSDPSTREQLEAILYRLKALEGQGGKAPIRSRPPREGSPHTPPPLCAPAPPPPRPATTSRESSFAPGNVDHIEETTSSIVRAISNSLQSVRPNHYYISNFDPLFHEFDSWCGEVDRARTVNHWGDNECLARIGNCLKGDSRLWLNEWATNDRSWTNFKREFKPLCPRQINSADILYDVMRTDSDSYVTYAEYARRSLLRLRIVKGLSDELISSIIIRGIVDSQIRAAATNAKVMPSDLIEFLSIYVKPSAIAGGLKYKMEPKRSSTYTDRRLENSATRKRQYPQHKVRCYSCSEFGHKSMDCTKPKRSKTETYQPKSSVESKVTSEPCSYCKKLGHFIETCFAKERSGARNKRNVNFCRGIEIESENSDVTAAIVQGVPVDVLIDSGSSISLLSKSLSKYLECSMKPAYRILKGIGNQEIECTHYVTLTLEFPELTIEADFFIVPSECINSPIIVGTDILNREGVTYIRMSGKQRIMRVDKPVAVLPITSQDQVKTPLVGEYQEKLLSIIDTFSENFITGTAVSTVNTGKMVIRLLSDTPVYYRPYRLSYDEKLRVRSIVRDLLDKEIIRESESAYASPVLLVKKKDGSDRMCVDYRILNQITVKDRFPLPLIEDHIDRLGNSTYFTCLDMATGFHQIPMEASSIEKTAFVTPEGHYEYLKMPYGLANAPVVYQRIISTTLRSFTDAGKVLVYIDDVLILSDSINEGLEILHQVLQTLTSAGFSINLRKCSFLCTEVQYLGRTISQGQVRPNSQKIEALVNAPTPQNVKQVRQFLGLAGYFRRYIKGYASETACIAQLTRSGAAFVWGAEQEKARKKIIECLTSEPVLAIFNPELPIEVHTDASGLSYGAVLLQQDEGGCKRVVAYYSKMTKDAETRYHSYELETLAVVKALQNFRHYLIGIKFKVVTDCNALKMTQKKRDLNRRVASWWTYLQDFDFDLEYRKGALIPHADYLSRNPVNVCRVQKPNNWAKVAQVADEETQAIIQKLSDGQLDCSGYVQRNDLLCYKYTGIGETPRFLCFVPKGHRLSLLRTYHDEHEHIGVEKCTDLILKHFWFPGLRQFVRKYISHCLICISQKRVPRAPLQQIKSWVKPDLPFDTIHADALGPLPESNGHKFVLIIVDAFSKYCLLYPMYKQDASELKRCFMNAVSLFSTPKLIVGDRGRMFESKDFVEWVTSMDVSTHYITPEMHQANGQVERYCRTVLNMIRIEANYKQEKWSDVLWKLQLTLNITKQKTTQQSALNLLVGTETTTPVIRGLIRDITLDGVSPNREAWRELNRQRASGLLKSNQGRQDAHTNKHRKAPHAHNLGDLVFVIKSSQSTGKLDSGMRGPYRVVKMLPQGRYQLKLAAGSYGKSTQAAAEYMVPWPGEWSPDACAAFFESAEDDSVLSPSEFTEEPNEDIRSSGEAVLDVRDLPSESDNTGEKMLPNM